MILQRFSKTDFVTILYVESWRNIFIFIYSHTTIIGGCYWRGHNTAKFCNGLPPLILLLLIIILFKGGRGFRKEIPFPGQ